MALITWGPAATVSGIQVASNLLDFFPGCPQLPGGSPTSVTFDAFPFTFEITGSGFTYDIGGNLTGGVVDTIQVSAGFSVAVTISGLTLDAGLLMAARALEAGAGGQDPVPGALDALFFPLGWTYSALPNDNIDPEGQIIDGIVANLSGNDIITMSTGNDEFWLGDGDDVGHGGIGNDTMFGGKGFDTVFGDEGNDTIFGRNNADSLYGGDDEDILYGGGGADLIFGNSGLDTLTGATGNDDLFGGTEDDILYGGNGADTLTGGKGNDILEGGNGRDVLNGSKGDDTLRGNVDKDNLYGDEGKDRLYGGSSGDLLDGGNAKDRLYGGSGTDTLFGGDGGDILEGGGNNDNMDGGAGADIFHFDGNTGYDVINNFVVAEDALRIRNPGTIAHYEDSGDLYITWDTGSIVLTGLTLADFDGINFL